MMLPRGSMSRQKSTGPRMDPWGTPYDTEAGEEEYWPMDTKKKVFGGDRSETSLELYP